MILPLPPKGLVGTYLGDAAKLELRLLLRHSVQDEPPLRVVEQTEEIARLLDLHHIYVHVTGKFNARTRTRKGDYP